MICAERHQCQYLIWPPRKAVEKLFESPGLFNTIVVLERTIQDCNQLREAFLVLTQGVSLGFHLFPCCAGRGGEDFDDSFSRLLLQLHLLEVQVDASSPLSVVLRPIAKGRRPWVLRGLSSN